LWFQCASERASIVRHRRDVLKLMSRRARSSRAGRAATEWIGLGLYIRRTMHPISEDWWLGSVRLRMRDWLETGGGKTDDGDDYVIIAVKHFPFLSNFCSNKGTAVSITVRKYWIFLEFGRFCAYNCLAMKFK